MRSTSDDPVGVPRATRPLARRVALACGLAAAMGGAAAAVAAGTSADRLLAAHDDETLQLAAVDLLDEVREEVEEEWEDHPALSITRSFGAAEDDATARAVYDRALQDEWDEVEHLPAAHARLDGAGGYLAGDRELAAVPPGTCDDAMVSQGAIFDGRGSTLRDGALTVHRWVSAPDS